MQDLYHQPQDVPLARSARHPRHPPAPGMTFQEGPYGSFRKLGVPLQGSIRVPFYKGSRVQDLGVSENGGYLILGILIIRILLFRVLYGSFRKWGYLILGVLTIRILLFRVLYWDPLFLETPIQGSIVLGQRREWGAFNFTCGRQKPTCLLGFPGVQGLEFLRLLSCVSLQLRA